jgi:mono/diheme cytochrome c family protein
VTTRVVASVSRLGFAAVGAAVAIAAMSGSSLAQSNATTAAPALTAADAAKIAKGRDVFGNYGCSACHTLADAGASGHVGPSFDENANLSQAFVVDRVTNGQGQMPAFGGQMSADEIDAVAAYIVATAKKP